MKLISIIVMITVSYQANAASYTSRKDSAGWTHYYDNKGSQRCISKKDAAGYTHTYCN